MSLRIASPQDTRATPESGTRVAGGVLDGFEFLGDLRERAETRSVPVIVLTAKDLSAHDMSRLRGNVERILEKGQYDRQLLLEEVRARVSLYTTTAPPPQR